QEALMKSLCRLLCQLAPKYRADRGRGAECTQKREVHAGGKQRIDEACGVSGEPVTRAGKSRGEIGVVAPRPDLSFSRRSGDKRSHIRRQFERLGKVVLR